MRSVPPSSILNRPSNLNTMRTRSLVRILLSSIAVVGCNAALVEQERVMEYHKRNHTWPPSYKPATSGWRDLMARRFGQIAQIEDRNARYNGYVQTVVAAIVAPNFTQNGWGLTRAPAGLVEELKEAIHEGLEKGARLEYHVDVIEGDEESRPLFIDRPELTQKVLRELKPMHEEWSGVPLVGTRAYGFRVYRNNSNLHMHVDKSSTHVISCILHIDHDAESEPWPILIEDFQGNTNEVVLESGDMLFYESSKCFHGRPTKFKGKWYSSIFVHYRPTYWDTAATELEPHYAIPPHWSDRAAAKTDGGHSVDRVELIGNDNKEGRIDHLQMVGTAMKEPDCPNDWCALQNTVKYFGPAQENVVLTTGGTSPIGTSVEDEL